MPIFDLPDDEYPSNSSLRRATPWIKRLGRVDTSKKDGFAFIGEFTSFNATVEAEVGTYYLACRPDVRSNGRLDGRKVTLYVVSASGELEVADEWEAGPERGWALRVRDDIAAYVNGEKPKAANSTAELYEGLLVALQALEDAGEEPGRGWIAHYPGASEGMHGKSAAVYRTGSVWALGEWPPKRGEEGPTGYSPAHP